MVKVTNVAALCRVRENQRRLKSAATKTKILKSAFANYISPSLIQPGREDSAREGDFSPLSNMRRAYLTMKIGNQNCITHHMLCGLSHLHFRIPLFSRSGTFPCQTYPKLDNICNIADMNEVFEIAWTPRNHLY